MSTITTISAGDNGSVSRGILNTNFSNLNSDKIESSYLDTDTTLGANSDVKIATQKAVKTYIDTGTNASETVKGVVEEATDAEVTAGTATGATGAKLFVTPAKLATVLKPAARQTFTSSGTYTKPTGLKIAFVQAWGGGGSGGHGAAGGSNGTGGGGGGGGYNEQWILGTAIGTTETVTIGDGGAAVTSVGAGNSGANTTFGSLLTAYGGGGGGYVSTGDDGGGGGGGGGTLGVGSAPGNTTSGGNGGAPNSNFGLGGATPNNGGDSSAGGGGGGGGDTDSVGTAGLGGHSFYGGGGGGGATYAGTANVGGSSTYGGGGGGGGSASPSASGGSSIHGGAGGAGAATGTAGTAPGGGGGGSFTGNSGAGGKGELRVTEFF